MCSGGQGELLWCTKLQWSSVFLFLDSIFEIPIGAMGYEIGGVICWSSKGFMRSIKGCKV